MDEVWRMAKFGRGPMFGSVQLGSVWTIRPNLGQTAKNWHHFCTSAFMEFCVNL